MFLLQGGGARHAVTWSGELPLHPDGTWYHRIQHASEQCARTGTPIEVATEGALLRCTPGEAHAASVGGGTIVWPGSIGISNTGCYASSMPRPSRQGPRARRGSGWRTAERCGRGHHSPHPRSRKKIDTLVDVLDIYFEHPHALGVVLTSGELCPAAHDETDVQHSPGAGFERVVPPGRLRESVVQLCTTEPRWLGNALFRVLPPHLRLGITSNASDPVGENPLTEWQLFA